MKRLFILRPSSLALLLINNSNPSLSEKVNNYERLRSPSVVDEALIKRTPGVPDSRGTKATDGSIDSSSVSSYFSVVYRIVTDMKSFKIMVLANSEPEARRIASDYVRLPFDCGFSTSIPSYEPSDGLHHRYIELAGSKIYFNDSKEANILLNNKLIYCEEATPERWVSSEKDSDMGKLGTFAYLDYSPRELSIRTMGSREIKFVKAPIRSFEHRSVYVEYIPYSFHDAEVSIYLNSLGELQDMTLETLYSVIKILRGLGNPPEHIRNYEYRKLVEKVIKKENIQ